MATKPKENEQQVLNAIIEWLTWNNVCHWRNNSGAFRDSRGHFYRYGAIGSPDIICIEGGLFVGIEVKRKGGKQSPKQKEFQEMIEKADGIYVLADCIEEVERIIIDVRRIAEHVKNSHEQKQSDNT